MESGKIALPLWPVSDGPHRALDFTDTDLFWFVFAVFGSLNFGPIESISRFVLPGFIMDHFGGPVAWSKYCQVLDCWASELGA